jgi:hypothetical protein
MVDEALEERFILVVEPVDEFDKDRETRLMGKLFNPLLSRYTGGNSLADMDLLLPLLPVERVGDTNKPLLIPEEGDIAVDSKRGSPNESLLSKEAPSFKLSEGTVSSEAPSLEDGGGLDKCDCCCK